MTWDEALRAAARRLEAVGIDGAHRDARRLLAHTLGCEPGQVTLHGDREAPEGLRRLFDDLIFRRAAREPVSHLTGRRAFYGRDFAVSSDVLDPRPETETLVQIALSRPWARVLDLGTGSGCILLTLLAERGAGTFGIGTDLSRAALGVAMRNAADLGLGDRTRFHAGDWLGALPAGTAPFDLIVSNPPYIAAAEMPALAPEVRLHEPRLALTDEGDGLGAYRRIAAAAPAHLAPAGALLFEIGPTQGAAVADLCARAGFARVSLHADLDGRDRVVLAEMGRKPAPHAENPR